MDWKDRPDANGWWWVRTDDHTRTAEVVEYYGTGRREEVLRAGTDEIFTSDESWAAGGKWLRIPEPPDRLTLAQQMAYAVLQGDEVAALALADLLQEQRAVAPVEAS